MVERLAGVGTGFKPFLLDAAYQMLQEQEHDMDSNEGGKNGLLNQC